MVVAKPDPTGQKFGRLTVICEIGRHPSSNRPMYQLQCDCGNIVERTRNSFDRKGVEIPSCRCYRQEVRLEAAAVRSKPDPTGQRFGRLTVLGRGDRVSDKRNSYIQLWRLQCECGRIIQIPRCSFEHKGQISCGCARKLGLIDNNRKPRDITGQRFGNLTACKLTGKKDRWNQPTWTMQCDCGNTCEISLKKLTHKQSQCLWINCGNRVQHPEIDCWYPATPSPYPKEAGLLLEKYLHLTELDYQKIDNAVEDEKRDRLIRACWIITYRRQQGEQLSELYEKRYIKKHLKYCSIDVFWRRKLESCGGFLYDVSYQKRQIGEEMTNATFLDYPELEIDLRGQNILSQIKPIKRLKFRRC